MSKRASKIALLIVWIGIVFGYLYLMQKVFDVNKSFSLFVFLALAGNLAYDGLKALMAYRPMYASDASGIVRYVFGFVFFLVSSLAFLALGAELHHYGYLSDVVGQIVSGVGFLMSIAVGMLFIAKAEEKFRRTNIA